MTDRYGDPVGGPVGYRVAAGVATVSLDAPQTRNALSAALLDGLERALAAAADDDAVRVVVLTHPGGTFCAGADLREALTVGMEATSRRLVALFRALLVHPRPVVAAVDGHVRAGGLGLVAACDLAVAGPRSTFAFTEARLGLAPAMISLVTSPRLTSRAASRYYLTGETFDAATAQEVGLLTLATDDLPAQLAELVGALLLAAPQGLREAKALTTRAVVADLDARGAELAAASAALFASPQAREGMQAFAQKRPPSWAVPPDDDGPHPLAGMRAVEA